jgi:hypothetical protein
MAAAAALLLAPAAHAKDVVFEDEWVRMALPSSWSVSGEAGEYWLDADQDVASLLLLPPDPDVTLDVRLAEIEEQFLSTGVIKLEKSEARPADESGEVAHYRRYRLTTGPESESTSVVLHEYSFVRSAVRVLLQVETPPRGGGQEKLFEAIHRTLEVRLAPDAFDVEIDPFGADSLAAPDSVGE